MARKGNPISVRLDLFRSSDSSWLCSTLSRSYSHETNANKEAITPKKGINYILISIKGYHNLLPESVESSLKKNFTCESIVITETKRMNNRDYLIGLHTHDASKNTYKNKINKMFPEVPASNFNVSAKKGLGSWARALCAKERKILVCTGKYKTTELFLISSQSTKKKPLPLKTPQKKGEEVQKKKGREGKLKKFFIWSLKKSLSFVLSTVAYVCKSVFRTVLNRFISLSVGLLFLTYVFSYKDGSSITSEMLWNLNLGDILNWLLDWRTPGLPPEFRTGRNSFFTKLKNLIWDLYSFVSWLTSFISNIALLASQLRRFYFWVSDFFRGRS